MAIKAVKYNPSATPISGTEQKGQLAIVTGSVDYGAGGFYGGVEDSDGYVIVSDTYSMGWTDQANAKPTFWKKTPQTDSALLSLINLLPEQNSSKFADIVTARAWVDSSNKYTILPLPVIVDEIRSQMTGAYITNYDNATVGNFIEVTSTIYNNVVNNLSGAEAYGTSNAEMIGASGTGWGNFMVSNPSQIPVSSGNYLIAWSSIPSTGGTQIIYSSSSLSSNAYTRVGNSISVSSVSNTRRYFVRKAPTVATSGNTYFATYSSSGSVTKGPGVPNQIYKAAGGDTVSTPFSIWSANTAAPAFQYIVTPTKSW